MTTVFGQLCFFGTILFYHEIVKNRVDVGMEAKRDPLNKPLFGSEVF